MATVNKDFKIKQGLIVEGSTATVAGKQVLTEDTSDQYIIDLVGGVAYVTSVSGDLNVTNGELSIDTEGLFDTLVSDGVATQTYVTDAIGNIDLTYTTDDVTEGNNLYYTDARVDSHLLGGQGIDYFEGQISVNTGTGINLENNDYIAIDRTTVDTWYDAAGAASGKQDTLTAGDGIDISGNTISVNTSQITGNTTNLDPQYAILTSTDTVGNIVILDSDITDKIAGEGTKSNKRNGHYYLDVDRPTVDGWYDASGTAANAAANAYANATAYADSLASNYDFAGAADAAKGCAIAYADSVAADAYDNAVAYSEGYTDNAVASLVDSAPELLDTLNELAQALQDNPNVIADLQDVAAGKQDALTAGNAIELLLDNTIAVKYSDGLALNGSGKLVVNRSETDTWYDAAGSAANAQAAAEGYADSLASNYDFAGAADAAKGCAIAYADSVAADAYDNAIAYAEEYTDNALVNLDLSGNYDALGSADTAYNNAIAYADTVSGYAQGNAEAYADTVAGYAQSNAESYADGLSVNYDASGAAANALADANDYADSLAGNYEAAGAITTAINALTTDDIEEGANNLYFQDSRVVSAISGADIAPNQIDINWARTETASWTAISTADQPTVCHQAGGSYGTIKYLVRVVASIAGTRHSHATEVLATFDGGNNVAVVEYGTIHTSVDPMATVTVLWNSLTNCYELNVTAANNNSEVMVAASALATID